MWMDKADQIRKLDKEYDTRPTMKIVKLPCGHESRQIERPGDQFVMCGVCCKSFLLTWSKIGKSKITGE